MTRPSRTALLATVLVVAAGCSGAPPAPETPETVTAAPVPTEEGGVVEGRTLVPAGVEGDELVSPALLAASHREQLRSVSFLWVERHDTRVLENGTQVRRVTIFERTWIGNGSRFRRDVSRRVVANGTTSWYNRSRYAGDVWHLMVETEGQRRIVGGGDPRSQWQYTTSNSVVVGRYLSLANSSAGPVGDGRYLIVGTGSTHPEFRFATNYTARAVVDPSGLIRRLSASYDERIGNRTTRVDYSFAVRGVGSTTVPKPAWLPANASDSGTTPNGTTDTAG